MGLYADSPQPVIRDPNAEASAALLSQLKAERGIDEFSKVGRKIDLEEEFQPKYTQLGIDQARLSLYGNKGNNGYLDLLRRSAPEAAAINQDGLAMQRERDIGDVYRLAGSARGAFDALNPDGAALLRKRNQIASDELDAGYGMTDSMRRQGEQSVRAAQASRGMGFGPSDVYQEAMYQGDRGRALFNERNALADRTIGLNQSFYGDPFQQILGRPSGSSAQQTVAGANAYNQGNVFNTHAYDQLWDFNANSQAAANIAKANNQAAISGALIGAAGSLGGAALGGFGKGGAFAPGGRFG